MLFRYRVCKLVLLCLLFVSQGVQGCSADGFECRSSGDCKKANTYCVAGWCKSRQVNACQSVGEARCRDGQTLEMCQEDGAWKASSCPQGESCDAALGGCKKRVGCGSDADCQAQPLPFCSDQNKCEWACRNNADCKKGEMCTSYQCRSKSGCEDDKDCPSKDAPKCEPRAKQCVACVTHADCKPNQLCQQSACVEPQGCTKDADCASTPNSPRCDIQLRQCVQCLEQQDCAAKEACKRGQCVPPAGCAADVDCPDVAKPKCDLKTRTCHACVVDGDCVKGEVCTNHACVPGKGCSNDADCKDAISPKCDAKSSKCVGCLSNRDCAAGQECVGQICRTKVECQQDQDCRNPFKSRCDTRLNICVECLNKSHCLEPSKPVCRMRVCAEERKKIRTFGESCELWSAKEAGYHACLPTLNCYRNRCRIPCDPKKPSPGDCKANQWCFKGSWGSVCLDKCDRKDGVIGKGCKVGEYCSTLNASYAPGYCELLAPKRRGPRQEGQECSQFASHTSEECDGDKGLFCFSRYCRRACDVRLGTSVNPACRSTEECVLVLGSLTASQLGGICVAKPVKKLGEFCAFPGDRCAKGLYCLESRCVPSCEPGQANTCKSSQICYKGLSQSYCADKCDASRGQFRGGCAGDFFCVKSSQGDHCHPLERPLNGPKQLGESCSNVQKSKACDSSKGLFCFNEGGMLTCRKACDPRKGNTVCGKGTCEEQPYQSFLGGLCRAPATQKLGAFCDVNTRCLKGLLCWENACAKECAKTFDCQPNYVCDTSNRRCVKKCDPANGIFPIQCDAGTYCQSSTSTSLKPGYCKPLKPRRQGPGTLGESCWDAPGRYCDGSKGLYCHSATFDRKCRKACNPRNGDGDCSAQEECVLDKSRSFLGGACLAKGTLPLRAFCHETKLRCKPGLLCTNGRCFTPCKTDRECDSGQACSVSDGICVDICDPAKGKFSSSCAVGFYCRSVIFGQHRGICMWLSPRYNGSKTFGQVCTPGIDIFSCDASQQLFCHDSGGQSTCQKACDPRLKTGCPSGQSCTENLANSYLGGLCK